jgi:hypothetical protein
VSIDLAAEATPRFPSFLPVSWENFLHEGQFGGIYHLENQEGHTSSSLSDLLRHDSKD